MEPLLEGVRVLDFTRVLAGPYASMILCDLGAEVVKIELPGSGDEARGFGPFQNGESAYFTSVNRGKKSVTLDIRTPEGQKIATELAGQCHILIENFRPGSMRRFGLDYETVHRLYPKLVYASVSGFGQTGPYAERPAYDVIIQAMGGLASITGLTAEEPVKVGTSIGDLSAALFAVIGILAALSRAERAGTGQQVDVSMLDCQVALLENAISRYYVTGDVPGPLGSRHPSITPFQFFRAADGFVVIAAGNDTLWSKLCAALGQGELVADPRFSTNARRTENQTELEAILAAILKERKVAEWEVLLGQAGVPCGPINTIGQVVEDPQIQAREMIVELSHPVAGIQAIPSSPLKFSENRVKLQRPAPLLGQHTAKILGFLAGKSSAELKALSEAGVV